MEDEAGAAKRAFPSQTSRIDRLVRLDEAFAELCRDFELAVGEHRNWEASKAPEREDRLGEYAVLIDELRTELERALTSADVIRVTTDGSRTR